MKKVVFKGIIISILLVAFLNITQATAFNFKAESGLNETAKETGHMDLELKEDNLASVVGNYIKIALSFVGILFFVLMIYGGFLWMTARGNEQQTEKAKSVIVDSIIGLVIIMSAYAITNLVISGTQSTGNPADTGDVFESCDPPYCYWEDGHAIIVEDLVE